jgi:hypothetical protein
MWSLGNNTTANRNESKWEIERSITGIEEYQVNVVYASEVITVLTSTWDSLASFSSVKIYFSLTGVPIRISVCFAAIQWFRHSLNDLNYRNPNDHGWMIPRHSRHYGAWGMTLRSAELHTEREQLHILRSYLDTQDLIVPQNKYQVAFQMLVVSRRPAQQHIYMNKRENAQDGATCTGFYTKWGAISVPRLSTCLRRAASEPVISPCKAAALYCSTTTANASARKTH